MASWSAETFWKEMDQSKEEPIRVRFSSAGQNFYFTLGRLPERRGCYQVQRYVPSTGEAIGQIKHTYRYLTHFGLLVNRFQREAYDYQLLYA
jgi:hypothetical protein